MTVKIKKVGVLTSGGDSPGMNAAIRSVVRTCAFYNIECIGIYRGYQGMIEGDFKEMGPRSVHNIVNKGGTILKSARSKEFMTPEGRKKAFENLRNYIDVLQEKRLVHVDEFSKKIESDSFMSCFSQFPYSQYLEVRI